MGVFWPSKFIMIIFYKDTFSNDNFSSYWVCLSPNLNVVCLKKRMAHFLKLGDYMVEIQESKLIISQKTQQLCIKQNASTNCSICATQHTSSIVQCSFIHLYH
jgi:hypothetical protein